MYILSSIQYEKKAKKLIPSNGRSGKLWPLPPMLFNQKINALKTMDDDVKYTVRMAEEKDTFIKLHDFSTFLVKVVECSDTITVFRITEDTPED